MNLSPLELLNFIHGETQDSRVHLCAKGNGHFERLASIPTEELSELLPIVAPHLERDGYFSINGFSQPSKKTNAKTGLPVPASRKANLQRLNGLFVDVDTGRDGQDKSNPHNEPTQEAMWRALENIERNGFPHPTLWAQSGRGFYVFWAFWEPLRAWPENIEHTENAQRALGGLVHPAADRAAVDAGRILRIAGTLHSTTGSVTAWRADSEGATRYPHEELWARLGVNASRATQYAVTQRPGSCPQKKAGRIAAHRNIERELVALQKARGGFSEGMRRYALTIYAAAKLVQGASILETHQDVTRMAGECSPPYPSNHSDQRPHEIVREATKIKNDHRTNAAIIARLGITQSEADALGLYALNPARSDELKKGRVARALNEGRPNRTARHEFVQQFVKANPTASIREVLAAAQTAGIKASLGSIQGDMATLRQEA